MPTKQPIKESESLVPVEIIQNKIYLIRGHKVMLDKDLAVLYGVLTRNLNKAVSRNLDRFPVDFGFSLTEDEFKNLMFQFGTSSWGGTRKLPMVFTEQGVSMLSSVLRSKRAIQVNIQIMRVFTKLREMMITHKDLARKIEDLERKFSDHNQKIIQIFEALRRLMTTPSPPQDSLPNPYKRTKVGFIVDKGSARKGHHAH
jgi:ORF6N domain